MATMKKPDYLNLPFEVHFERMNTLGYELMHKPGKPDWYLPLNGAT
jgi:hypothetical protein